jgi:TolB protein
MPAASQDRMQRPNVDSDAMAQPQTVEFATQPVQPPARSRRTRIGLAVALLVTLGAIGAILGARAISVIGRPPANELAFIDVQGALHTIDDRGENARAFVGDGFTYQFPAWSPDGSRIAAIGTGPGGGGVFVFDTRTATGARPITAFQAPDHPPFYVYWTPDGRQLTFLTSERGNIALRVATADGSGTSETILEGQPLYWAHADAGRILVHSGGHAEDAFLGETGLAPSSQQPSSNGLRPGPFRAPSISSTRRFSAVEVSGGEDTNHRIVIAARDGGTKQEIPVPSIAMFEFSPVGSLLAYVADPAPLNAASVFPYGPLRVFDAVSGNDRLILDGDVAAFFWSPDGKTIAALRIPTDEERQQTAAVKGRVAAAAPIRPSQTPPLTGPGASLRLEFKDVATGETRSERAVQVSDLFANEVIPFFDQYALSHRFWSRDSRSIVLPLADLRPESHITVIDADGSRSFEVGPGAVAFWSP